MLGIGKQLSQAMHVITKATISNNINMSSDSSYLIQSYHITIPIPQPIIIKNVRGRSQPEHPLKPKHVPIIDNFGVQQPAYSHDIKEN
jgi:hypothetical protein